MKATRGKKSSEAAVPVSYRLQFWTVVAAFSVIAVQDLFFLVNPNFQNGFNVNIRYLLPVFLSTTLFPLLVFLACYFTSNKYAVKISRWFIAVIKSFIVISVYGLLQSVWSFVIQLLYFSSHNYDTKGLPPYWVRGNWFMYAAMVAVLAALFGFMYVQSKRKK
jgi:hypothetical protein